MHIENMKNAAIIIPIYKPDQKFCKLLDALKKQKDINFDLYIIDSGSNRADYENHLEDLSYQITKITPDIFNHGGTRRAAAQKYALYPFLFYMTQDAIPADEFALSRLLSVFNDGCVGCAYGRQLPAPHASVLAAHARLFNYPAKDQVKSLSDIAKIGIKAAFISDTFAVYRTTALRSVGWFPENVILGEDTYVAAKMLLAGWKSVYCADACVYHSHDYSIWQEFQRYFDTGVFHAREPWIRQQFGQAEGEGKRFVISEMKYVLRYAPYVLPEACVRNAAKFLGYRLGLIEKKLPLFIKRKYSMNRQYWK